MLQLASCVLQPIVDGDMDGIEGTASLNTHCTSFLQARSHDVLLVLLLLIQLRLHATPGPSQRPPSHFAVKCPLQTYRRLRLLG